MKVFIQVIMIKDIYEIMFQSLITNEIFKTMFLMIYYNL
jgi:hypothetical protein